MVNYAYTEQRDVYRNFKAAIAIDILGSFSFPVYIKEPCKLNYIDILLAKKSANPQGSFDIEIRVSQKKYSYTVPISQLLDNQPLRMLFDETINAEKMIGLSIEPHYVVGEPGNIAIYTSHDGPCVCVNGTVGKNITLHYTPMVSIVIPTYNTPVPILAAAIDSVKRQKYEFWEICLVDDASTEKAAVDYLIELYDPRIKKHFNSHNEGIALSSNTALTMATGEFVAFLDHDDLITEDALLEVVSALNDNPQLDFIYSDEDKTDNTGAFHGEFYKPDWNYGLFLSHMYTCHLGVYRKALLDKIRGFREGYEGSQDYDLVLRLIEHTKPEHIKHIPKILYHWRITPGSTSENIRNKPFARMSAVRAIEGHLQRMKRPAHVSAGPFQGHYHVVYYPTKNTKVSLIVPFRDKAVYLKNFVDTLKITAYEHYDVMFVNNVSAEPATLEYVKSLQSNKRFKVVDYDKPFNFSEINNYAADLCKESDVFVFMNNDLEIMDADWLTQMLQQLERSEVAAVGAKLLYIDHRIQHAGVFIGVNGVAAHGHKNMWDFQPGYFGRPHCIQDITAVTGACMMVRREDFKKVGGFDPKLPRAFNDIDLCLKLRRNKRSIVYTPYARLFHHESASRGLDSVQDMEFQKAIEYMDKKWGVLNYVDPFYNPNLTRTREDFSVA